MFSAKDVIGQQIFLRDSVSYQGVVDDMGLIDEDEGRVILIPEENVVQVQPLTKGSVPILLPADEVKVVYSLVQKIANLSSHEELQKLVLASEERYDQAVKDAKPKRRKASGTGSTRAKAAPKEETTSDLDLSGLLGSDML